MNINLNKKEDKKTATSIWDNGGGCLAILDAVAAVIAIIVILCLKGFTMDALKQMGIFFGGWIVITFLIWLLAKFR